MYELNVVYFNFIQLACSRHECRAEMPTKRFLFRGWKWRGLPSVDESIS